MIKRLVRRAKRKLVPGVLRKRLLIRKLSKSAERHAAVENGWWTEVERKRHEVKAGDWYHGKIGKERRLSNRQSIKAIRLRHTDFN